MVALKIITLRGALGNWTSEFQWKSQVPFYVTMVDPSLVPDGLIG